MSEPFVRAIEAIYQSAAEPTHWPQALQVVADCFDGFKSDKFDEYLKLPENQRVPVNPTVLAMCRRLTDEFHRIDLMARPCCPSFSLVCKKPPLDRGVCSKGKRKPA